MPQKPYMVLLLLQLLLIQLIPRLPGNIFIYEMDAFLPCLPPEIRTTFRRNAWRDALTADPAKKLELIHGLIDNAPPERFIDHSPCLPFYFHSPITIHHSSFSIYCYIPQ